MQPVVAEAPTAEAAPPPVITGAPESAAPAAVPDPGAPPPAAMPPACGSCGAPLLEGQHWCLECGSAAPGRTGRRPGWRVAGSVVALTLLLAGGAVAATYAALSSSSRRAVSKPLPSVAQVQPAAPTAPAVPSAPGPLPRRHRHRHHLISRAPTIPVPKPGQRIKPVKPVATPKVPKVTAPTAPNPTPTTGPAVGTGRGRITLDTDAASTYNPYALPLTRFGDPAAAIDGDPTTAWTVQADSNGRVDSGLAIDLKSPHRVKALRIQGSRGMAIQIYATGGAIPTSITDPAWTHVGSVVLTRRPDRVALQGAAKRYQGFALWIPTAPAGSAVKIAEVAVFR